MADRDGRAKPIRLILLTAALIVALFALFRSRNYEDASTSPPADLADHPIYSKYDFGHEAGIIDIGAQPLYMPTGLITEAMDRDEILRSALSELGLEIRLHPFLKGDDVNYFLRRGDLEGGIGGDMPAVTAASSFDIIIPALIQQGFCSIMADHYMAVPELRRKRIGYALGSNAHYALLNVLASEGLTEKDVILVPMEMTDMPEALRSRRVSAFCAWEPTPTLTLMDIPDAVVIHQSLISGFLYFLADFHADHPEAVRQIIAAETRAIRWLKADRRNLLLAGRWNLAACNDLAGRDMGLSVEQMAELARLDILGFGTVPFVPQKYQTREGRIFSEFNFLKNLGKIPKNATWDKVQSSFDSTVVEAIISQPERYKLDTFEYITDKGAADGQN